MLRSILLAVLAVSSASAHFIITYPPDRGDSYNTQFQFPCGGLNSTGIRYAWPTTGGSLALTPLHDFAFTTINIAIGNTIQETTDVNRYNHIMRATFNQTGGNGTFCVPTLKIPKELRPLVQAGVNATIQVVQLVASGSALYNCADITFSDTEANRFADPDVWDNTCFNSTGMSATYLGNPGAINYTQLALELQKKSAGSRLDRRNFVLAGAMIAVAALML